MDELPGGFSITSAIYNSKIATDTDTGQAFTYLGIGDGLGLFISAACIILMLWLGILFSRFLLQLAPVKGDTVTASGRFGYLWKIAVLASLLGIILIIPFRIMPWNRALAPVFVTLLSVPILFSNAWKLKGSKTLDNEVNEKIFLLPIIFLVVLLLIFQLVLAKGIEM